MSEMALKLKKNNLDFAKIDETIAIKKLLMPGIHNKRETQKL